MGDANCRCYSRHGFNIDHVERRHHGTIGPDRDEFSDRNRWQSVGFALTVALATSNSFLIPTHQVNALIMGPGGYRVADFTRIGGIITVLYLLVLVPMLNLVF